MNTQEKGHSPYTIDVPGRETIPGRWSLAPPISAPVRRPGKGLGPGGFAIFMAGLAALVGMTLGIVMGISQDFTLAPAHAHLNLLGWVTLALYGLYHRSAGQEGGWLAWTQVLAGALGALLMAGGLGLYLNSGDDRYVPMVVVGSLLTLVGMILFIAIVLTEALTATTRRSAASA